VQVDASRVLKRAVISFLIAVAVAAATIAAWKVIRDNSNAQIARIAESESYAARSQLIRNVDLMLASLRSVHRYWATYGHLPRGQWAADAALELVHFDGIEMIVWSDIARGIRYVRTPDNPVLDYRPTDAEWLAVQALLDRAAELAGEATLGPFVDDDGNPFYEVYIKSRQADGVLIAVVDSRASFSGMLQDESPGYAISVLWDEAVLYRRGEPAGGSSDGPSHAGMIRTSMGNLWKVIHTPTGQFVDSLSTPALPAMLSAGLAIAALVGLLLFENGRARSRAQAAEVAERQLAELNRSLEEQIAERTKELANRSADLGTITDSVAHDLRNPLNSISVNTQLLEQQFGDALGEDGRTALQRTSSGVKRMTEILDRLLGLSVISHATFHRERVDLVELVTDIFDELSASEPPPPVECAVADLPEANADPTLVRTLAMNLLSNALKYTRSRKDRRIDVGYKMLDGVPVYFVRDNGIGFDEEYEERLFHAFERLGQDGGSEEGVGLGLNIAVRVVSRHDGRIWAESKPDQGAAFYFTLEPSSESGS
jgi:signal transduction histidine kinase